MNLKDSFRYMNFIENMIRCGYSSMTTRTHALETKKMHYENKVNPDTKDWCETLYEDEEFVDNDTVLDFMLFMVEEKERLAKAISEAKRTLPIDEDIDALVAANKCRQEVASAINRMLMYKPSKIKTTAEGQKFNINGDPVKYTYDVEVTTEDNFDRAFAKRKYKELSQKADDISSQIEASHVNVTVDYDPPFSVSLEFDDVIEEYKEYAEGLKPFSLQESDGDAHYNFQGNN